MAAALHYSTEHLGTDLSELHGGHTAKISGHLSNPPHKIRLAGNITTVDITLLSRTLRVSKSMGGETFRNDLLNQARNGDIVTKVSFSGLVCTLHPYRHRLLLSSRMGTPNGTVWV
jgi:hypothetical protein